MTKILAHNINELNVSQQNKLADFWQIIDEIRQELEHKKPSEIIISIIQKSKIESTLREDGTEEAFERLQNIHELITLAGEYDNLPDGEAMDKFLEESSLVSDQDTDTDDRNKVKLMTIHASKGLEFKYVFICGLEDGLFPSDKKTFQQISKEEAEEERRLFYVALTRAREVLYLSHSRERMLWGKRVFANRSQFIDDIPDELYIEIKHNTNYGGNINNLRQKDSDGDYDDGQGWGRNVVYI